MDTTRRIILHIGLHKTATTWLQREVWPRWPGIRYLGKPFREPFASYAEAIEKLPDPAFLVSSESMSGSLRRVYLGDARWRVGFLEELERIATAYAADHEIGIILGLRRHESWLLSIYKHYLKHGGVAPLREFLALDEPAQGLFDPEDFLLAPRVAAVRERLGIEPFVFFLEELREAPERLAEDLGRYIGSGPLSDGWPRGWRYNEGVGCTEAILTRRLNARFVNRGLAPRNGPLRALSMRPFKYVRRLSRMHLLPRGQALALEPDLRRAIAERYREDLRETLRAIEQGRPGFRPPATLAEAAEDRGRP
jgi:hypothetical protein